MWLMEKSKSLKNISRVIAVIDVGHKKKLKFRQNMQNVSNNFPKRPKKSFTVHRQTSRIHKYFSISLENVKKSNA